MQALNVTLNGGTGVSAWQPVQGGEGYTQTVVTSVAGIELVYEDPNAIVSYTVENDDTSNYDAASDAGIILSSIEPTDNAWTYTCVFHADSAPVSSVDIDLLVYGNIARGTEQQGSPATAEEITAQVLAGLETRVLALENEMPDKADKSTTYTKAQVDTYLAAKADQATTYTKAETDTLLAAKANDNAVVHLVGAETLTGTKTFSDDPLIFKATPVLALKDTIDVFNTAPPSNRYYGVGMYDKNGTNTGALGMGHRTNGGKVLYLNTRGEDGAVKEFDIIALADGTAYMTGPSRAYVASNTSDVATIGTLDAYTPMVRTTGNQVINGAKTFQSSLLGATVQLKTVDLDVTTPGTSTRYSNAIMWVDENNVAICKLWISQSATGQIKLGCDIKNSDNTWKFGQILAQGN